MNLQHRTSRVGTCLQFERLWTTDKLKLGPQQFLYFGFVCFTVWELNVVGRENRMKYNAYICTPIRSTVFDVLLWKLIWCVCVRLLLLQINHMHKYINAAAVHWSCSEKICCTIFKRFSSFGFKKMKFQEFWATNFIGKFCR